MTKQYLTIFFLVLILPVFLFAGNNTIIGNADGSVEPFNSDEVLSIQKARLVDRAPQYGLSPTAFGTEGLIDTVYERDQWPSIDSRFGWFGHDVMIQWFKAPADMILKSVGFGEAPDDGGSYATQVEVKVVEILWDEAQILDAVTGSAKYLGYYEATGNGYNDAAPLRDDFDGTNVWSTWHVADSTYMTEPFGNDIWSDAGLGAPVAVDPANANATSDDPTRHFVDMNLLGFEPTIAKDQIFGVAIFNSNGTMDDFVVRTWSTNLGPHGAFKYYANGRLNPGVDYGWWARLFDWDFFYVADVIGDLPPAIANISPVPTTLSTSAQTVTADVTDENPGGTSGVASAYLYWSTDGMANWDSLAMVNTTGDEYTADIPGQAPGTVIDWFINATDNNGNKTATATFQYRIYLASGAPYLIVFNGYTAESGYPQSYYFGIDDFINYNTFDFWHDVWAFGPLTADLLNNYTNVIEITTTGPLDINSTEISAWLAGSADRNYMLAGDEWLGSQTGWVNTTYNPGDFQYDILGIAADYNDINYAASGDQTLASQVYPVAGTLLGDSLEWKRVQVGVDVDSMLYDPTYEIEVDNWLDGVDVVAGQGIEVDMQGLAIDGATLYNIAIHRTLPAGNKIAFLSYDPLSINAFGTQYYWFGFSQTAPQVQVLRWFGSLISGGIDDELVNTPNKFNLSQNYPNPFNPSTTIEYSVPNTGKVELVLYNVQGQKISTLVSGNKTAGSYKTTFDASNLASGVYFYKLTAGSDVLTKKMLVVK